MNWKIIFQLSVFGLIMAFGTLALIHQNVEPIFWLFIFVFCAWVIAKVCNGKFFLHGFLVSMVNCIWITIAHVMFNKTYMANHPDFANMNKSLPPSLAAHPQLAMALTGILLGALSGVILGFFSIIASKIVKQN